MTEVQKSLPKWILIVSGIIGLMEIMVSVTLCMSPGSVVESVDLNAKGVDYLIYMWAGRQFALGVIFAYATIKRSVPMLTIAYIFFFVMMICDLVVGITQKENALIIAAAVMTILSGAMIYAVNKKR